VSGRTGRANNDGVRVTIAGNAGEHVHAVETLHQLRAVLDPGAAAWFSPRAVHLQLSVVQAYA